MTLFKVEFWIQIHDLPVGYMTEFVGKQLDNFFGTFLQYDSKNNSSIWREFMCLKIQVDIRKLLKRRNKICKKDKTSIVVHCKYEKLGDFYFLCGLLSHTKCFYKKKLEAGGEMINKDWGHWLRAQSRRAVGAARASGMEEGNGDWGK